MKEKSVVNDIRFDERIIKGESINIKTKVKKKVNKISKNNNFEIKKEEKKIKDAETQIIQEENKVEKMDDFDINNLDYVSQNFLKNPKI